MPYRDGGEIKGPLTHYGFTLAQLLFGRRMWSIRVLDLPLVDHWNAGDRGHRGAPDFALARIWGGGYIFSLDWFAYLAQYGSTRYVGYRVRDPCGCPVGGKEPAAHGIHAPG